MRKKFLIIGALAMSGAYLTGCTDWSTNVFVHEKRIIKTLEDQDTTKALYPNTRAALASYDKRTRERINLPQQQTLCDMAPYLRLDEASLGSTYKFNINKVYEQMYSVTFDEACDLKKSKAFKTKTPEIEVINTAKNSGVLSNAQVKEITQAVKTCDRAKFKVMSIKDAGKKLTVDDYEAVMDITADCADYELEKALNE